MCINITVKQVQRVISISSSLIAIVLRQVPFEVLRVTVRCGVRKRHKCHRLFDDIQNPVIVIVNVVLIRDAISISVCDNRDRGGRGIRLSINTCYLVFKSVGTGVTRRRCVCDRAIPSLQTTVPFAGCCNPFTPSPTTIVLMPTATSFSTTFKTVASPAKTLALSSEADGFNSGPKEYLLCPMWVKH